MPCPIIASRRRIRKTPRIAQAKAMPNGSPVRILGRIVTARFGTYFYIEEADRSCGICVYGDANVGDIVDVSGTIDTVNGEQTIIAAQILKEIKARLGFMADVGLGYLTLDRNSGSLSGGEAQRVKLSTELSKRSLGRNLYILDEPTTGLHFADIQHLIDVLHRLVDAGNTVIVIEHNLDVVKVADWVIDLGPEGGAAGGRVIAEGSPEVVADTPGSHTGALLRAMVAG